MVCLIKLIGLLAGFSHEGILVFRILKHTDPVLDAACPQVLEGTELTVHDLIRVLDISILIIIPVDARNTITNNIKAVSITDIIKILYHFF